MTTDRERALMHLAQAATRTDDPDAILHIEGALEAVRAMPPTPLEQCPVCERVGLPERIAEHDCNDRHRR